MKIVAKDGYVWAEKDLSAIYGKELYLGIYDSEDNYTQVPEGTEPIVKEETNEELD